MEGATAPWDPVPREHYMRMLRAARDMPLVKVLTGIRRCGKSTLLAIEDNYPKTLITFHPYPLKNIRGVRVVQALDWLLGGDAPPEPGDPLKDVG